MNPYDRPTDSLPISRRTVIMNTGLAAAALAGLSSCTNYSTAPASEPSAAGLWWLEQCQPDHSPSRKRTYPWAAARSSPTPQTVITQPKKGEFKAFSAICTHQGCIVAAVTTTINCPCHGSKYSITDGSVVNPPAPKPLPPKTIKVDGDTPHRQLRPRSWTGGSGSSKGNHLIESRQSTAHERLCAHAPQPPGELLVRGQPTQLHWMPVRVVAACHSCYLI